MKTLTVSSLHRQSGAPCRRRYTRVPSVRFSGQWLARLGYTPGRKLVVILDGDRLVLTLAPEGSA